MNDKGPFNHRLATVTWGVLFIWWGVVIGVDSLTIGLGAVGTGIIFLGVNALRIWKGRPARIETSIAGISMIVWGGLDHTRSLLGLSPWLSFGLLFFVIGLRLLITPLVYRTNPRVEN